MEQPFKLIFVTLFLILLLVAGNYLFNKPLNNFTIRGEMQFVQHDAIKKVLNQWQNKGLLTISLTKVHKQLMQNPWLKQVSIRRVWPNSLDITVVEATPIAIWQPHGKHSCQRTSTTCQLLNNKGEYVPINPLIAIQNYPRLVSDSTQMQQAKSKFLIAHSLLKAENVTITTLQLQRDASWLMTIENSITVKIGSRDFDNRVARLRQIWQSELRAIKNALQYIDLRYSNGLSVQLG